MNTKDDTSDPGRVTELRRDELSAVTGGFYGPIILDPGGILLLLLKALQGSAN